MAEKVFRLSCTLLAVFCLAYRADAYTVNYAPSEEVAVVSTSCSGSDNAPCLAVSANSECVSDTCACVTGYKVDPNDDTKCLKECTDNTGCTVADTECDTGNGGVCRCAAGYKGDATTCTKIIGQSCTDDAGCTGDDANAKCVSNQCACKDYYREVGNVCTKTLTSNCGAAADCTATVTDSICDTTCKCNDGYTDVTDMCKMVFDIECTGDADCNALTNTACGTGSPKKCECATNYEKDGAVCRKGNEVACTADTECMSNAQCTGDPKKCMCKTGYDYNTADKMCKVQNSAQSVVLSTGLFIASLLVMFKNFL